MIPPNKPRGDEPRINQQIDAKTVRLIDANGNMLGVVTIQEALKKAEAAELDLVEIVPTSAPPVCKVMDFGKYKYEAQKKAHEARRKQKVISVKEIKLRPMIDKNDLDIKLRNAIKFLGEGDKVKVTLKFRGREMAHQDLGHKVIEKVREMLDEHCRIEFGPRMEGTQIVLIVAPK